MLLSVLIDVKGIFVDQIGIVLTLKVRTESKTMFENLIKRLRDKASALDYDGWVDTAAILEEASDAIEELSRVAEVNAKRAMFWAAQAENYNWISMTERPPKEELAFYQCYTDAGLVVQCLWTNNRTGLGPLGEWGWRFTDVPSHQKVTHWMPLPKPPKENGKSET